MGILMQESSCFKLLFQIHMDPPGKMLNSLFGPGYSISNTRKIKPELHFSRKVRMNGLFWSGGNGDDGEKSGRRGCVRKTNEASSGRGFIFDARDFRGY